MSHLSDISMIGALIPYDQLWCAVYMSHPETQLLCQAMKKVTASQTRALVTGKMQQSDEFCSVWCTLLLRVFLFFLPIITLNVFLLM